MNKKTKKGSPHKDPEKKLGDLMIASVGRLLKEDDVKGKPHARTRSEKIKDILKDMGSGAISGAMSKVKGVASDKDVKMLKKLYQLIKMVAWSKNTWAVDLFITTKNNMALKAIEQRENQNNRWLLNQ